MHFCKLKLPKDIWHKTIMSGSHMKNIKKGNLFAMPCSLQGWGFSLCQMRWWGQRAVISCEQRETFVHGCSSNLKKIFSFLSSFINPKRSMPVNTIIIISKVYCDYYYQRNDDYLFSWTGNLLFPCFNEHFQKKVTNILTFSMQQRWWWHLRN